MLILILIDVQYSQKAVFSFKKGLNAQNRQKSPHPSKISDFSPTPPNPHLEGIYPIPNPLLLFGKPCV